MSTTDPSASTNNSGTGSNPGTSGEAGRLGAARQSAADAYQGALERTTAAYQAAREKAGGAVETVRETARTAGRRTGEGIEANPVAAVVGGLALGAIAGALLPRTRREEELLGPVGRKVTGTAREAVRAAQEAGRQQFEELGLSKDGVQRRLNEFTDRAVGAVRSSAGAAADAASRKGGA